MAALTEPQLEPASTTGQKARAHEDGFRKLTEIDWIPVPDEGWAVEAASPADPCSD